MKYFLIEGHRPSIDWEKQTRVVEAQTLAEAAITAENVGIEVVSIQIIPRQIMCGRDMTSLRQTNPHLFDAWQTEVIS